METDYRKLCVELFGTDDVKKLRRIAAEASARKVPGRKKKFTQEDINQIQNLLAGGMTLNSIAEKYRTSRQVISRYINAAPSENYSMRMTYMFRNHPCTIIDVDFMNRKINIKNRTDDILHRAFGVVENPDWDDFEYFLEDRCFPETRGNCKDILKWLAIDSYDPLQIIEKTGGRCMGDDMWIRIKYYRGMVSK